MKLPLIPQDKANHLIYGLIIYTVILPINIYLAMLMVVFAGVGKEVYDHMNRDEHVPDLYDAIYIVVGGLIGFIISIITKEGLQLF